jgi:hypothetical protein
MLTTKQARISSDIKVTTVSVLLFLLVLVAGQEVVVQAVVVQAVVVQAVVVQEEVVQRRFLKVTMQRWLMGL